jgi:hypothetical protein
MEQLARALVPNGRLYFEGELYVNYSETLTAEPSTLDNRRVSESNVPLALCYTGDYKNQSNWFIPNLSALKAWFEAAALEMRSYRVITNDDERPYPLQRIEGVACRAAELSFVEEIGIFGKRLELPSEWWRQFYGQRARRRASSQSARAQLAVAASGAGDSDFRC